jgi:DNA-binding FadR family transcriptional regulator
MTYDENIFPPIKSRRAFEDVSAHIKELIFQGVLKPGDRLPSEHELSQRFNVGRQTTREALRLLELSGFVRIQKGGGGGAFINDTINTTIQDLFLDAFRMQHASLRDLTAARIEVERLVLDHALSQISPDDLAALRDNVTEAQALIDAGRPATESNVQFHKLLARASKNFAYEIIMDCIMAVHLNFLVDNEPGLQTSRGVVPPTAKY